MEVILFKNVSLLKYTQTYIHLYVFKEVNVFNKNVNFLKLHPNRSRPVQGSIPVLKNIVFLKLHPNIPVHVNKTYIFADHLPNS